MFDPLKLKGKENETERLRFIADDMKYFGHELFTPIFIDELNTEVPKTMNHTNNKL